MSETTLEHAGADLAVLLTETTVRLNPFAGVTGVDELGAPIGGGIDHLCENPY